MEDAQSLADDLNVFYARFDQHNFSEAQQDALRTLREKDGERIVIGENEVENCFNKLNPRSAHGPDNITGIVLKRCSASLSPVFTRLFQESLDSGHIPLLWKTSTVVPVPKKPYPQRKE